MPLGEHLAALVANSFLCLGFYVSCKYERDENLKPTSKMILWWVRYYGQRKLPEWLQAPLYSCLVCMSSLHSIYMFWPWHELMPMNIVLWFGYVLCLAGMNQLSWLVYKSLQE